MTWSYSAVVVFKDGHVKDVSGRIFGMEDRFSASIIVRSEIKKGYENVDKIIIETLTSG